MEHLESLGVHHPQSLLSDLLSLSPASSSEGNSRQVDLRALTSVLEEELFGSNTAASEVAVRLCLSEVRSSSLRADNLVFERSKLRADLSEANQRALLLAQEIDDQNARLEKQGQQRVK